MKGLTLLLIALAALMLPVHSVTAETPHSRVAFVPPSTSDAPFPAVCILDVATLAMACPLPSVWNVDNINIAWSPRGTMIASFQLVSLAGGPAVGRIVVLAADGTERLPNGQPSPALVIGDARVRGKPMWSNDGRRVAGIADGAIVIADVTGGHLDTLNLGEGQIFHAAWSPDSTRFAIAKGDPSGNGVALVLVDAETGVQQTIRHFAGNNGASAALDDISWSPDGQRILFSLTPASGSGSGRALEHWIIGANGKNANMLYHSGALGASFSSDGKSIAFDGYSGAIPNIFVANSDGSDVHQLTHNVNGAFGPRIDGDGRVLYWDLDTTTMNMITFTAADPEHGTVKTLLRATEFEWAPAPGPLPRGAVTPTPTPQATATVQPPPVTPSPSDGPPFEAFPLPTTPADLRGPNVGTGTPTDSDRSWYGWLGLVGAGALVGGLAVRRIALRKR